MRWLGLWIVGVPYQFLGGVAEWLKAADCKSARIAYIGSNPIPSTNLVGNGRCGVLLCAGVAQW